MNQNYRVSFRCLSVGVLCGALCIASLLAGCEGGGENEPTQRNVSTSADQDTGTTNVLPAETQNAIGSFLGSSGCKRSYITANAGESAGEIPDNVSRVIYSYDGEGRLTLRHINAGFNCAAGTDARIEIDGTSITVTEIEVFSSDMRTSCSCRHDLDVEITGLPPGVYDISFVEPLWNQSYGRLEFVMDLSTVASGSYSVTRYGMPWMLPYYAK